MNFYPFEPTPIIHTVLQLCDTIQIYIKHISNRFALPSLCKVYVKEGTTPQKIRSLLLYEADIDESSKVMKTVIQFLPTMLVFSQQYLYCNF